MLPSSYSAAPLETISLSSYVYDPQTQTVNISGIVDKVGDSSI